MDNQGLAAAVHLPVNLRVAECTLDHQWDSHADVAIVGAGFYVRLEFGGKDDQLERAVKEVMAELARGEKTISPPPPYPKR